MAHEQLIRISLAEQTLELLEDGVVQCRYAVSTALNGPGECSGSGCTPRGWHAIHAKIGAGVAVDTVFVGREPTGEIYSAELAQQQPDRDWILTRILWLGGLEPEHNQGGQVDTLSRYIYLHGCPDNAPMGVPGSHGCVRMRNADVVELFERAREGTHVWIQEGPFDAATPRSARV
ncbi:MAG: L,D-transpeptidase [Gammaproteobacteria bacterium]|nr:L,D-transpeptidase [Gammaproteobacteria bacterium]